eukprot:g9.t1
MVASTSRSMTDPPVLSTIDIEHIRAVLVNTVEKLSLIGAIRLDVQAEAEELTASVGEGIYKLIQKQRDLEAEFNTCVIQGRHSNDKDYQTKASTLLIDSITYS